jgi:hypothetical protein
LISALADLQYEPGRRRLHPRRGSEEVGSPFQPLDRRQGSSAEALAAMGAASRDHLAAALRGHAGAETVAALAHELARLIGPFHVDTPLWRLFRIAQRAASAKARTGSH